MAWGQRTKSVTVSVPYDPIGSLDDACVLERDLLTVSVIAANDGIRGGRLAPTNSGWLAHNSDTRDVIEIDSLLNERTRWGSFDDPVGLGMTLADNGRALIDNSIPALRVLDEGKTYPLFGVASDGVVVDRQRIVYGTGNGIFELSLQGVAPVQRLLFDLEDFGMPLDRANGLAPKFRLRTGVSGDLYVAWVIQSSIWLIQEGKSPTRVVQRCVPEPLLDTHRNAPRITVGGVTNIRASVASIQDFVVLPAGKILVLGALSVGEGAHRSIELYGQDGGLIRAWELPIRHAVGRFDRGDPTRLLLYRAREREDGLTLVRIQGAEYPRS